MVGRTVQMSLVSVAVILEKPDSVLFEESYHLSSSKITLRIYLPTP